jgi:crotonobetainyl-CoA:carnitine CoA-transferase CaiB-like acyl-CoA transferase
MILGDMGADVITVDQARPASGAADAAQPMTGPGSVLGTRGGYMRRNARRVALDLKHPDARQVAHRILERADVMVESFRPGVAARLGLDPNELRDQYPRLVICSISGYGQDGPYRDRAGHDLNYIALSGLLDANRGNDGMPSVPGTVLADLAGGGMQAVVGILAALVARERTGEGQLVDVALHEGVVGLLAPLIAWISGATERSWTLLTREAPWYNVYETSDGRHVAVAAVEPRFYATFCELVGHPEWVDTQFDTATWPAMRETMKALFSSRPLAEWRALLEAHDTCVSAVPTMQEVLDDEHLRARGTFVDVLVDGAQTMLQVRPLPRLSETPLEIRRAGVAYGHDTDVILAELGYDDDARRRLRAGGAVGEGAVVAGAP